MKKFIFLTFIMFLLSGSYYSYSQLSGCTDSNALNFNQNATINDGSCYYDPTYSTPTIKFNLPEEVEEASGLIFFNNAIWIFNDSGGEADIYKIDTINGNIIQTIQIANAQNVDWEDITQDEQYIYIGDFGNNYGNRTDLTIYKINKSQIPENGNAIVSAELIYFQYEDQKEYIKKDRSNNFDCEAMLSVNNDLLLFSKNWIDQKCKVYQLPKIQGEYTAVKINEFNSNGLITGATINPQSNKIVLVGYQKNVWIPFIWNLWDFQQNDILSGNKRRIDFPQLITAQMEGVEFIDSDRIFISAEKTNFLLQNLYELNTNTWTGITETAIDELIDTSMYSISINPNPVTQKKFVIEIMVPEDASFSIDIYNMQGRKMDHLKTKFLKSKDSTKIKFKRKDFSKGMYFVKLSSPLYSVIKKLIIKE